MDLSDPPPSARGPHVGAARGPLPVAAGPLLAAVATMALAIGSIALGDAGAATASRPVSAENPFPEVNPCASGVSEVTATIKVCALIQRLEDGEWRTAVFTEPRQAMVWIQLSETGPTAHRKNTVDGVAYVQDNEGIGLTERDDWYVSIQTWNMPPGVRFMTETTPAVYVDVSTGEARTFVFRCESGSCYVPAPTSTPTVTSRPANATRTPSATPSPTEVEATTTVATSPTASGTGTASATATPTGMTDATGTPTATPTPEVTATPGPMGTETTDPVGTPTTEPSATPDFLLTPAEPSGTVTPAAPGSATPSATETAVGPRTPSPYATAPAPPSPSAAPSALPTPSPAITPAVRRTAYLPLVIRRPGSTARPP